MATNENIRVVQLTDDNDNPVSPVVNVGSLYDKNGNKVDNLLSYKVAGTDVPVPEIKNVQDELTQKVDQAILDMKTQVEAFTMNGGLPVNDVRSAVVADGETIHAGDVVDVVDGKAKTTIEKSLPVVSEMTKTAYSSVYRAYDFNGTCVCATTSPGEAFGQPALNSLNQDGTVNNTTFLTGSTKFCGLVKVSDTQLIAYSQGDTGSDADQRTYVDVITSSDNFKTLANTSTSSTVVMRSDADVWDYHVVQLDSTHALVVYMNGGKIRTSIATYSGTTASYSGRSNVTQAAHSLELTKIGNGTDGTIRYVLSYIKSSRTIGAAASPNAAGIRIITVSSDYANVVIGNETVVSSTNTACITTVYDGIRVYALMQNTADSSWKLTCIEINSYGTECTVSTALKLGSVKTNITTSTSGPTVWDKSAGIVVSDGYIVCCVAASDTYSGYPTAYVAKYDNTVADSNLKIVSSTQLAACNAINVSAFIGPNGAIEFTCIGGSGTSSYSDIMAYTTKYGTIKILNGDVAGDFAYNSTDAIALESGSSGDTISIGYGGYCRMAGSKAGSEIESDGVCATSPCDGWLDVTPKYKHPSSESTTIVGTYTGTGKYGSSNACKITGVQDAKIVVLAEVQVSRYGCVPVVLARTSYSESDFVMTCSMYSGIGETGSVKCNALYYKFDGDALTWYSTIATNQFNTSGDVYSYTIIR